MKKWEYKTAYSEDIDDVAELCKHGKEGWELVLIIDKSNAMCRTMKAFYFKREIEEVKR